MAGRIPCSLERITLESRRGPPGRHRGARCSLKHVALEIRCRPAANWCAGWRRCSSLKRISLKTRRIPAGRRCLSWCAVVRSRYGSSPSICQRTIIRCRRKAGCPSDRSGHPRSGCRSLSLACARLSRRLRRSRIPKVDNKRTQKEGAKKLFHYI